MAIASTSGFIGGSNTTPEIAPHPMGLTSRAGMGFLTGATAQTLTADSPEVIRIVNPSGAITQDLPTAGVLAGRVFRLVVSGATETNYVALRSSGGNEIDRIGGSGFILVQALIDSPTSNAHWEILDVMEENAILVITGITGANTNNITARMCRRNRLVHIALLQSAATATAVGVILAPAGSIPARFRNTSYRQSSGMAVLNNGGLLGGFVDMVPNGSFGVYRYDTANFTGTCGVSVGESGVTYFKQ